MGYRLCIAEKPSVAKDIADVVGANKKNNGYFIGNDYIVTWALGHLIKLSEPEKYDEKYRNRYDLTNLPIFYYDWKWEVINSTREQYEIIKKLMTSKNVDMVIDCGDDGPEGYYLQWLIREYIGCNKEVKRFCTSSLTKSAIKNAMNNLHDIDEYKGIILAEYCKARTNYMFGINFSRLYTSIYIDSNDYFNVGVVKTPTLAFVVERFLEHNEFEKKKMYSVEVSNKDMKFTYIDMSDKSTAVSDISVAEIIAENTSKIGIVIKNEERKVVKPAPELFDINELQIRANRIYDYSPLETLNIAQTLYEKKMITYPRTDCQYLPNDMIEVFGDRIRRIVNYLNLDKNVEYRNYGVKRIFNDAAVTDHFAIIVDENFDNPVIKEKMSEREKKILDLIMMQIIKAVLPDCEYLTLRTIIRLGTYTYETRQKTITEIGWCKYDNNMVHNISFFELGEEINIDHIDVIERESTAPPLLTEADLLVKMEEAGCNLEEVEYKEAIKNKGIGTKATRGSIINDLFEDGYVVYNGKSKGLKPTQKGLFAYKIFDERLESARLSALIQVEINKVELGIIAEKEYFEFVKKYIVDIITNTKSKKIESNYTKMERKISAVCPYCFNSLSDNNIKSYCDKCKDFAIYKSVSDKNFITSKTKKALTEVMISKLCSPSGLTSICTSSTGGKKYKANFSIKKPFTGKVEIDMKIVN